MILDSTMAANACIVSERKTHNECWAVLDIVPVKMSDKCLYRRPCSLGCSSLASHQFHQRRASRAASEVNIGGRQTPASSKTRPNKQPTAMTHRRKRPPTPALTCIFPLQDCPVPLRQLPPPHPVIFCLNPACTTTPAAALGANHGAARGASGSVLSTACSSVPVPGFGLVLAWLDWVGGCGWVSRVDRFWGGRLSFRSGLGIGVGGQIEGGAVLTGSWVLRLF